MLIESVSINSITDSIKNLYQVVINYEGDPAHGIAPGKRVIEVYAYGLTKSGNPVIRAYQPYGDTASTVPEWKFFRLDRIKSWSPTYKKIITPPDKFNPNGDRSMSVVYLIADFNKKPDDNISGPKFKQVGKIDNIDKILSDRDKDKIKSKSDNKIINKFRIKPPEVNIKQSDVKEPEITPPTSIDNFPINEPSTSKSTNIKEPEIKNIESDKKDDDESNIYKTKGDEELNKIKNLNKRMDNVRKIDLSKIPKR